jgi:hypothetical protein
MLALSLLSDATLPSAATTGSLPEFRVRLFIPLPEFTWTEAFMSQVPDLNGDPL